MKICCDASALICFSCIAGNPSFTERYECERCFTEIGDQYAEIYLSMNHILKLQAKVMEHSL